MKKRKKPPCDPTEVHNCPADCEYSETKTVHSRVWRTFLKIDSSMLADKAPVADPLWLAQQGMNESSPIVLELLRERVLPLYRHHQPERIWFFVHNRESGVPTTEDDKGAYLDITLVFDKPRDLASRIVNIDAPFVMTRPDKLSEQCAGWDLTKLNSRKIGIVYALHNMQAQMLLEFIASFNKDADTMTLLKHLRQYMHYLANVTQMRIA